MAIIISVWLLFVILIINFFYNRKTKDLEERNKRLAALGMLDEIMISSSTLSLPDIGQKIIDSIPYVLGFDIGLLALIDEDKGTLTGMAVSNTPVGVAFKNLLVTPFEKMQLLLNYDQNLAIRAIKENKSQKTTDFSETFKPFLSEDQLKTIHEKIGIKNLLIHPIRFRERVIGVIVLSIPLAEGKFSAYNRESLENLIDIVGIAISNAMVYQQFRNTSTLLVDANQKLKVLDQIKDDFVSIASHELRTPMTAIRSYAWMALHRSDVPLSKNLEKYVTRILISTERLINLVNDMLNVSRIESGKIEINPEPIDILSLVKDIVDEVYYSKSEEKNIQFKVAEKTVPKVLADPEKLRQVFLNLVGNSLKFTPNGGIISFDFFSDGKTLEIGISDTGVGISKEDLSKLFHKFSRLDNSYTAAATSGGTGLGLYISKHLIELMHGKIWASSEGLNKGTTFTISLPTATPETLKDIEKYKVKVKGEAKGLEAAVI